MIQRVSHYRKEVTFCCHLHDRDDSMKDASGVSRVNYRLGIAVRHLLSHQDKYLKVCKIASRETNIEKNLISSPHHPCLLPCPCVCVCVCVMQHDQEWYTGGWGETIVNFDKYNDLWGFFLSCWLVPWKQLLLVNLVAGIVHSKYFCCITLY